jgi:hypothetical protein
MSSEADGKKTWPCVTCEAPVYRKESECPAMCVGTVQRMERAVTVTFPVEQFKAMLRGQYEQGWLDAKAGRDRREEATLLSFGESDDAFPGYSVVDE